MATQQQQEPAQKWDRVVRRSIDFDIKAFDPEKRSFDVVASTDTIDGHGDIVEQSFDLKRYKKNPVVLWMHNSFGFLDGSRAEDFLPIGRAENVKVTDGQLEARIILATADANPIAEKVFLLWQQKILRAVSIGFRPGKVTREENNDTGKVTYRLANNELFEISVVAIPSNPDAVAKALHAAEREEFSRLAAPTAAKGGTREKKPMNEELQKALEAKAVAEQKAKDAEARATKAEDRIKELEKLLGDEKLVSKKLEGELDAERAETKKLKGEVSKGTLDALQGVKFEPAERKELDELVDTVGIERVKKLLEKRTDIPLTKPVTVDGKAVGEKPKTAPEPVEQKAGEGAADALLGEVETRASKDEGTIFAA
jgi:HK97 family phage prohead protease